MNPEMLWYEVLQQAAGIEGDGSPYLASRAQGARQVVLIRAVDRLLAVLDTDLPEDYAEAVRLTKTIERIVCAPFRGRFLSVREITMARRKLIQDAAEARGVPYAEMARIAGVQS